MSRFRMAAAAFGIAMLMALTPRAAAAQAAQCSCVITDLGTLGGSISYATAINDAGQVVGASRTPSGRDHAFLWAAATGMVDLGTLGGQSSIARGINNAGQVVGSSETASGDAHAFLWTATAGMVDLGTLGGNTSNARGINDAGQIVGDSLLPDAVTTHAFVWTAATGMVDLGTLGGRSSRANAVNHDGQVVGVGETAGTSSTASEPHAFLWTPGAGMTDLGTLAAIDAAPYSEAYAINHAGQVVGHSLVGTSIPGPDTQQLGYFAVNSSHAFLWAAATGMMDLGILGGYESLALGINDAGQVVGTSTLAGGSSSPFLWTATAGMVNLGTLGVSGWTTGINNAGQVVGHNATHALLWRPVPTLTLAPLTSNVTFPVTAGTPVTWTTSATGGAGPSFQFWVFDGSTWSVGRDWSPSATWTWEPSQPGAYSVQVWARNTGSPFLYDAWQDVSATISTPSVLTVTAVTSSPSTVAAGVPVTWTVSVDGGAEPLAYRFLVYDGTTWTVGREWGSEWVWRWTPPMPGTYRFQVWVRNARSFAVYDAWRAFGPYTATRPTSLTVTRLTADPAPAGTPVQWTATAAGGTAPYTYKFWVFDGVMWAVGQDWSPSASWTWLPSNPGSYHVQVWVRNAGSVTAYDAYGDADLTITAPVALQAVLGSDRTFPVPAGTPVTWTARGIGGTAPYTYKFWVFDGSTWSVGQEWSPAATWSWIPSVPGSYFVQAWIRNAGSSSAYDAWTGTSVLPISSATSIPMATVTIAPMSPLFAREPAVVTATATGGAGPYTYQFWVYDGSTWTIGQAWSGSNTFTWQPPAAGTYWIQAWVRNVGTATSYDAWTGLGPLTVLP